MAEKDGKFGHDHYVPILKGRPSEMHALTKLSAKAWDGITPLIEVPAIPAAWGEVNVRVAGKSIAEHLKASAPLIVGAVPKGRRFFLDCKHVESAEVDDGEDEPVTKVMADLRSASLLAVPVVGLRSVFEHLTAARSAYAKDQRGFCLRVTSSDLGMSGVEGRIKELLDFLGVTASAVDLVLDYGAITDGDVSRMGVAVATRIKQLPFVKDWRTLTLAATATPQAIGSIPGGTTREFPRQEMAVWAALLKRRPAIIRMPAFGDYTAFHPIVNEVDPRIINRSPSIRYAGDESWFIARGKGKPKKKGSAGSAARAAALAALADSVQYPKLAAQIMDTDAWRGEAFSWGAAQIAECVRKKDAKKPATGTTGKWIAAAVSHHIEVVVAQIATQTAL